MHAVCVCGGGAGGAGVGVTLTLPGGFGQYTFSLPATVFMKETVMTVQTSLF